MFASLARAFGDLADRQILSILVKALLISALVFVALALGAWALLVGTDPCGLLGSSCPLDTGTGGVGAMLLGLLAAWLLFPGVAIGVISAFADSIAAAVEARHYPGEATVARRIGVGRAAWMGVKSTGRILLYNLLALPFYIALLITGIGPLVLFVIVNGIAFGRDLGELAASRYGGDRSWLRAERGPLRWLGVLVSLLFLVPFANLLAPVVGVAAAIHFHHRSRQVSASG